MNKLKELGYIYEVFSGLQFDINTVLQSFHGVYKEGYWCDHNCSRENGNYDCPAAFLRNSQADLKNLLTLEEIEKGIKQANAGMEEMNKKFIKEILPIYVKKFSIPQNIAHEIKSVLGKGKVELNVFGGNPELHPNFLDIISFAKRMGWKVTATTTGKKFLADEEFISEFIKHRPDSLAISADDFDGIEELKKLINFPLNKLKAHWLKANPLYGQRKKAYESIYVAKLAQKTPGFPLILFNIVVHPGNINYIAELIEVLNQNFQNTIINPYLSQSSFSYGESLWEDRHLNKIQKFIDLMIKEQLGQAGKEKKSFVPRLPYWLMLKSLFLANKTKNELKSSLSGFGIWKCFRQTGAGRYLQVSSSFNPRKKDDSIGGHPGCFWNNQTVTQENRFLWSMSSSEIADFMLKDRLKLAGKSTKPCPGCIMPRLCFDGPAIELGLDSQLLPYYLSLRKKYLEF